MGSGVTLVSEAWGRLPLNVALRVAPDGYGVSHFAVTECVMEFGT